MIWFQIQAGNGEVTITNDGATILKQMNVIHPAAKMVCDQAFIMAELFFDIMCKIVFDK